MEGWAGKEGVNVCSTSSPSSDDCNSDSLIPNILVGLCSFGRSDTYEVLECSETSSIMAHAPQIY